MWQLVIEALDNPTSVILTEVYFTDLLILKKYSDEKWSLAVEGWGGERRRDRRRHDEMKVASAAAGVAFIN